MTRTILVTDGEHRAALAVSRSLGRSQWHVEVAASRTPSLAGASRWCRAEHRVPDPLLAPDAFAQAIARLARMLDAAAVVPITDASTEPLLDIRRDLPALPCGGALEYRRLSDKAEVSRLGAMLGFATPAQTVLESPRRSELPAAFPAVVKPARSLAPSGTSRVKLGVAYAANLAELDRILAGLPAAAFPVLVQERVIGPGTGVFLLRWNGVTLARFVHTRIREKPPAGGVSVLAGSIPLDPVLMTGAERLLDEVGWNGAAMVEFKRDRRTGVPYLMEVNARFWGSLQLAIDAGVDFPRLLLDAALGHPVEPVTSYRIGVRTRWFWGDVDHLLARLWRSPEALSLPPGGPSRAGAMWDFLAATFDPRIRSEVCRLSDPLPAVRETLDWFRGRSA